MHVNLHLIALSQLKKCQSKGETQKRWNSSYLNRVMIDFNCSSVNRPSICCFSFHSLSCFSISWNRIILASLGVGIGCDCCCGMDWEDLVVISVDCDWLGVDDCGEEEYWNDDEDGGCFRFVFEPAVVCIKVRLQCKHPYKLINHIFSKISDK